MIQQKITPFLWFDRQAEEAARFYVSIFPDSAITGVTPGPDGVPMAVNFRLAGLHFTALNGGPLFQFNEAVSLSIACESQAEIDDYWAKLTAGGSEGRCGWLKDRYGLSWQVTPVILARLMSDPDRDRARRVVQAFMGMTKFSIQALLDAAEGR